MTNWPWPFDAVQGWFEGLWNTVWDAANSASQWLWNQIKPALKALESLIEDMIMWLWNKIKPLFGPLAEWTEDAIEAFWSGLKLFIEDPAKFMSFLIDSVAASISDGVNWISNQINTSINNVTGAISSGLSTLWTNIQAQWTAFTDWIGNSVSNLWNGIQNGFSTLWTNVQNGLGSLWDSLAGLASDILSGVTGALGEGLKGFLDWMLKSLTYMGEMIVGAINNLAAAVQGGFNQIVSGAVDWITGALTPGSPDKRIEQAVSSMVSTVWNTQIEMIKQMYKSPPNVEQSWNTAQQMLIALIGASISAMIAGCALDLAHPFKNMNIHVTLREAVYWAGIPAVTAAIATTPTAIGLLEPLRYYLNETFQPAIPTVEQLIRLRTRGLLSADEFLLNMNRQGLSDVWANLLLNAYWNVPSISALMDMYWRGLIDEAGFKDALRFMGIREDFINPYFELTKRIPGASDLIRFQLREVFRPDRRPQLLAEYPSDEYFKWMAAQGYSKYWAENYWAAHWELPSITQLNEMLIRRVIDHDTWRRYVVYNDYIPEAIPWLERIIYSPYTRVDARRMWALGVISDEELYNNYRDLGYDHEHAEKMTLWTKVYERLPDLERLYRNGWINAEEFRQELAKLGLSAEQVDWIFKTVVPKAKLERTKKERDLTKTDILRLHRIGELDDREAMEMLMDIGYDEDEATYLIALNKESLETEVRDLTTSQILKAYRYEILSRDEAKAKLVDIGWKEQAAETLLKLEDIKLQDARTERMRERDLTRTDIIKAIKRNIIDVQTGYNYLGYLGYSDWEIRVIFALEEIPWPTGG